jgi:pimeloyl-ACP methyl ester carboxylesterase
MSCRPLVRINDQSAGKTAKRLVVLIPGMGSTYRDWKTLITRIQQDPGNPVEQDDAPKLGYGSADAHWMSFEHGIKVTTLGQRHLAQPGNLETLARQLRNLIHEQWVKYGTYEDVVLIGHSMGGLLARRVYLLAAGAVPGQESSPWGQRVSRIILFAAVNRGFRLDSLTPFQRSIAQLGLLFYRRIFYFEDVLCGSDFITNLRIDWIRHFHAIEKKQPGRLKGTNRPQMRDPLVVQFIGDQEELITPEDNKDILAFPNGHYRSLACGNHANLYHLEPNVAPDPDARYLILREAFFSELSDMDTDNNRRPKESPIKRIVMILHGIRADRVDNWVEQIGKAIMKRDSTTTLVSAPTYGYFTAFRFALPAERRRNIPIFRDEYTELMAVHPEAKFSIIAHSNGTYMLGHSLRKTPGMRFENIVLAGSALPEDYDWEELIDLDESHARQVGRVMNERASRDYPIAILCNMLNGLPWQSMKDIGRGGYAGFRGDKVIEIAYHQGDHGSALMKNNQDRLVEFVFGDQPRDPGLPNEPGWFFRLSNFSHHIGLTLILAILAAILWISFAGMVFHPVNAIVTAVVLIVLLLIVNSA